MRYLLLFVFLFVSSAAAENWSQFRGDDGGRLPVVQHPLEWSSGNNLAWSIPMEGSGWSSPVVVGDQIFLTSAESEQPSKPKGMMAGVASMRTFRIAKPA